MAKSSRQIQATGPGSTAAHNARAIVLPAPAGPVTTVSGDHRVPSAISWVTRGRCTAQSGTFGTVILDARIGVSAETAGRLARAACLTTWAAIGTSWTSPASDLTAARHWRPHPGHAVRAT